MLLWHLASITFLFRWIFRDPKVDMRFLGAGVVLPDLIDLGIATFLGTERGELFAHSLIVPSLVAVVVILLTRRGRRRRAWMALVVAWMLHLVVDGMWVDEAVLFWPIFGIDIIEPAAAGFWPQAWERATSDLWRWIFEVIGIGYLVWLYVATGLTDPKKRRQMWSSGRLPPISSAG